MTKVNAIDKMIGYIVAAMVLWAMLMLLDITARAQGPAADQIVQPPQSTSPVPTHAFTPPVATDAARILFLQAEIDVLLTKNEELRSTIDTNQKACNNRVATDKFYGTIGKIFKDANADQAIWDWDAAKLDFNQRVNPTPTPTSQPIASPAIPNAK